MDIHFLTVKQSRIDYLLRNVPQDPSGSLEVQSHWAKYTCVVMSGTLEDSIKSLLKAYADERAPIVIANYVWSRLHGFQTAKTDDICHLLSQFDKGWEAQMRLFLTEERKVAINSIVGNRHRIAHGLDSSVTIHQLKEWYPHMRDAITYIANLVQA